MSLPWERVVAWGGVGDLDSLRHIWHAYVQTARKLGIDAECVPDAPESRAKLGPGVLCIAADVWSKHIGAAVKGCDYATHNMPWVHPLIQTVAGNRHVALQVYTSDAEGYEHETWDECRLWHAGGRTLFTPWGSSLLAEEFFDPVFNPQSDVAAFVGAIWDDGGLGNEALIPRVRDALVRRRLRFVHFTQISDAAMLEAVRTSRIAPAFAGDWQVGKNYLNCRTFKAIAAGTMAVTNVPKFRDLFGDALPWGESVEETIDVCLGLSGRQWAERVRSMQAVVARFTFRENLRDVARALEAGR